MFLKLPIFSKTILAERKSFDKARRKDIISYFSGIKFTKK